jgi:hypothetical protein
MQHDQIRRGTLDASRAQAEAMPAFRAAVDRFLGSDGRTEDQTAHVLTGGLTRRSLFRVGGVTVAGAAVLAACGSSASGAKATTIPATTLPATTLPATTLPATTLPATTVPMSGDVVLLRTASSLEFLAVAVYQKAIDSGLVTTTAVGDAAMRFQEHHQAHADYFVKATKDMGGEAFTMPNPAVLDSLQSAIAALKDEKGVIQLALTLERAAAATYQSGVGKVADMTLNKSLMSVGGVEHRHAAVLAGALGMPPVPLAFTVLDGAVKVGTGV